MSPLAEAGTAVGPSTALDRARIVRFVQIPTREAGRIGVVALQLALVLLVIRQFQLESRTFFHVMLLVAVGFVVHALLPLPLRLPFFAALSLASVVVTFGMWDGFFLITLGMALIVICHLPIRMASRVALLIATGILFAAWRVEGASHVGDGPEGPPGDVIHSRTNAASGFRSWHPRTKGITRSSTTRVG